MITGTRDPDYGDKERKKHKCALSLQSNKKQQQQEHKIKTHTQTHSDLIAFSLLSLVIRVPAKSKSCLCPKQEETELFSVVIPLFLCVISFSVNHGVEIAAQMQMGEVRS